MTERWAEYREATRERDEKIISRYKEGNVGYMTIANEMGVSRSTVQKVLNEAARAGEVTLRPRGYTLSRPGTSVPTTHP